MIVPVKYQDQNITNNIFMEDRALFYGNSLSNIIANFREMKSDFGIIPVPKYDEAQASYYAYINTYCNGGVAVDMNWQSSVEGLYVVGEAAGTFGVYRPGGSALNSTQVGALRAAEHISCQSAEAPVVQEYALPRISYGRSNVSETVEYLRLEMSRVADFDRSTEGMKVLYEYVSDLCEGFFDKVTVGDDGELCALFRLYDMALTQRAVLSAMLASAEEIGTHGSALIDGKPDPRSGRVRTTRTLTKGSLSELSEVSPMPDPELWFETLLARQREKRKI
jgi:succinate dehydrogenase/fumarate reductase flavoprotein subunit